MYQSLCCLLILFAVGCSADPALDLPGLEGRAREGDGQAIADLVDLLASPDQQVSDHVYTVLVDLDNRAIPALKRQVLSDNRQQREYVIAALGTLRERSALPAIAQVLNNASLHRRYVSAWALGEIGAPDGIPPLIAALDDENAEVRRYATRALIKFNQLSVPALIGYLQTAQGNGAAGAIRALGDIADPRALDVLLKQAEGPHQAEAYLALGKLRNQRAEQTLIKGLTVQQWRARMNAAMALGPLGTEKAIRPLRKSLEDDVHVVREWSARSLEMITGEPVLYRNSKNELVRPYNVYH
ncbi:MAG: HEAT repeat domain-containing protein [Deltaproteobacteria bacterium]|jgi:HEAT repeat protein|nr:HEAT repeat domain-containing protein [Deltaproteobacteria bacterium]